MKSIFIDKNAMPTLEDLQKSLGHTFAMWKKFEEFTKDNAPGAKADWHFGGDKFGWSYRIKDSKRILVYLLPRDGFFKIAFVFGQKATDMVIGSDISELVKNELLDARQYAEGRGIRIEVKDSSNYADIQKLIKIKIAI